MTDKAVSRWERGVGFPDVKLLEPLAESLQITVMELIQCEQSKQEETAARISANTPEVGKNAYPGKRLGIPAVVCCLLYFVFHVLSEIPVLSGQMEWMSVLDKIWFLVTVGAFLYAAYQGESHGTY